ncbi:MAG: porin family protein [Bacteroidota bacterium]
MKNTLMTLSLLTLAMVTFAATFDLGIKAGYNTSKISTDLSTIKADSKGGYNFGAFGRFGGEKFYLQPEFLYVVRNEGFSGGSAYDAIKMKSIQVPVLLGLKLIDLKLASIRAFTGPAISFSTGYESDKSFKYNFNNSTWDYQLGAGVDVLMFTFDIRYEWGLSKSFDTSSFGSNFTSKGNTFSVNLGFKFM